MSYVVAAMIFIYVVIYFVPFIWRAVLEIIKFLRNKEWLEVSKRDVYLSFGAIFACFMIHIIVPPAYTAGKGATEDYATARARYEKAAANGDADAMYNLGELYANGDGVARDYTKAREWYAKAAAKGNASAMISPGLLNARDQGVTQDDATGRERYEKAPR